MLETFARLDLDTEDIRVLGTHDASVASVVYSEKTSNENLFNAPMFPLLMLLY